MYCYAESVGAAANVGLERRALSWDGTDLVVLYSGFPVSPSTSGTYEFHGRWPRARKLEYINQAVGELGLYWWRPVIDESLTTITNQWRYTLPTGLEKVTQVLLQVATDASLVGYPYADAKDWNWSVKKNVTALGVETWYLQFGTLPPPSRTIRLIAEGGYYTELATDADLIAIEGAWARPALGWIMEYASFNLWLESSARQPTTQSERQRIWWSDRLELKKKRILEQAPAHANPRLNLPGWGDGDYPMSPIPNSDYLAAFHVP